MRKRTKQVTFRISQKAKAVLDDKLQQTGLDFSSFMRLMCETIPVRTFPHMNYRKYVLAIHAVSDQINEQFQIYNKTKSVFPDRILNAVNELDALVNQCREEIKMTLETDQTGGKHNESF